VTIAQTVLVRSLDSKQDVAEVGRKAARLAERIVGRTLPSGLLRAGPRTQIVSA